MPHLTPGSSAQAEAISLLDPGIDPSTMAPSTLVLALRKKRREAKRQQRSEVRRSNLRASTLKTEAEIAEREIKEREAVKTSRKGRKALHEGGEARGVRNLSQAELIAEALEEEERNKEELRKWLRREEERRELRRVGRKRVRGPRWTWISRTVGKVVEVVENEGQVETRTVETSQAQTAPKPTGTTESADDATKPAIDASASPSVPEAAPLDVQRPATTTSATKEAEPASASTAREADGTIGSTEVSGAVPRTDVGPKADVVQANTEAIETPAVPPGQQSVTQASSVEPSLTNEASEDIPPARSTDSAPPPAPRDQLPAPPLQSASTPNQPAEPSQYTRNYLVLSQVPGGLSAELALVLGDHVAWDQVKYIPARNRPINRRPPLCPFTGKPAKYRHPTTMIPYADVRGYREIEALLRNRYVWSEGGFWVGGEEDVAAEGAEEIEGWRDAVHGGWMAGLAIPPDEEEEDPDVADEEEPAEVAEVEPEAAVRPAKKGKKRGGKSESAQPAKGKKRRR